MKSIPVQNFEDWREKARALLVLDIEPQQVMFIDQLSEQSMLPLDCGTNVSPPSAKQNARVPKKFLELAESAACFRDDARYDLFYRILWRLTHGEDHLLDIPVDEDVHRLLAMDKQVHFDAHKMKAFVRFRRVVCEEGEEHFIAWHRPAHRVLRRVTPFFTRRFQMMSWCILTPDESCHWDGHTITFTPGVPRSAAPAGDELEELWKTYYRNIFNPARIKLKAMKKEMPRKYWSTMPETELIPDLLQEAPLRVEKMVKHAIPAVKGARAFFPATISLPTLREAAATCQGCDIHCNATQTVFGEGPASAPVVFVGEQPGDNEDLQGRPFIGPAGQIFDEALATVGIPRDQVYVTNAVKHFKFEPRGKKRIHSKPNAREIQACRPWVEAELSLIKPRILVLLGNTAGQSLIGPAFRITRDRGQFFPSPFAPQTLATFHPSALLRIPDANVRADVQQKFLSDLRLLATQLATESTCTRAA